MVAAMVTSRICEGYTNDAVDDIDDHAGDHAGQALPVDPPRQQAFVEACVCMRFRMRLHAIPMRRETPRHL